MLLEGLARDGGLYVPDGWPTLDEATRRGLAPRPYAEVAAEVMFPFLCGNIERSAFDGIVEAAYAGFRHKAVAPLTQLGGNLWVMELFHGPTLAFKDVAMQVLGRLFDHVLEKRGQRLTIIGATSGDTGSAAIEAFRGRENCDIFILHPKGRTSEVQRKQMTTVDAGNVFNVAVEGTFDDCQALVKAMFNDASFRDDVRMSGRQQHQLGARHAPSRLLRDGRGGAGGFRRPPADPLLGAHRQLRRRVRRLHRRADGRAGEPAGGREQPQRHPHPRAPRRRPLDGRRCTRRSAPRWTSRPAATSSGCSWTWRPATPRKSPG